MTITLPFDAYALIFSFLMTLSLFIPVVLLQDATRHLPTVARQIISGLLFGGVAIVSLATAYEFMPGIYMDARNIVIALCGLFIGPIATLIATTCAITMRFVLMGGAGAIAGAISMAFIAALSVGFNLYFLRKGLKLGMFHMLLFAIIAPMLVLPSYLLLPEDMGSSILLQHGMIIYLLNGGCALLVGSMLIQNMKKIDLIEELSASEKKAEDAQRAKSIFLAKMSHEIRTPMNAIIGFAELAERTELNQLQKSYISNIKFASRSMQGQLEDILSFSSIEAEKLRIVKSTFNLKNLLETSVTLMQAAAQTKALEIELAIDQDCPDYVFSDELRLQQILLNLLDNAIKFTLSGYIRLKVTAEPLSDHNCRFTFAISDTGIGIHPDFHEKVFEPFEQGEKLPGLRSTGAGLGLSIARNLVQILGGTISLDSLPGRGSTFYVRLDLPVGDMVAINAKPSVSEPQSTTRKIKILVAEDIEMNQLVLQAQLENKGYDVTIAGDGAEAIELIRQSHFDLVLMDMQMPGMGGLEATRIIREELRIDNNRLPIIAVTAHALASELKECLEAGMDDTLTKPIESGILYKTLEEWLNLGEDDPFVYISRDATNGCENNSDTLLNEGQLSSFINFVGQEMATNVYGSFVRDSRKKMEFFRMNQTLSVEELQAMSSMASSLGLNKLMSHCNRLLDGVKKGLKADVSASIDALEVDLAESIKAFEQYLFRSRTSVA